MQVLEQTQRRRISITAPQLWVVRHRLSSRFCGRFNMYHNVLHSLADKLAPVKRIIMWHQHLAPWMDDDCRELRRHSHRLQRCYQNQRNHVTFLSGFKQRETDTRSYRLKESFFWFRFAEQSGEPKKLWQFICTLMGVWLNKSSNQGMSNSERINGLLQRNNIQCASVYWWLSHPVIPRSCHGDLKRVPRVYRGRREE